MSIAIKIENLSKRYRLGVINRDMLYKDLQSRWAKWRGKEDPNAPIGLMHDKRLEHGDEFWALRNINLEIPDGKVFGIIGRNGAGKSTLLKILSQITAPTEGRISVRGRVASLLEVGTGFHPELTGRENVFLNGAILGMSRQEVAKKFDEIVEFAEIKEFIDTPVKRYSSGMYVRLAFGVAAHLDPDILVVDEVLAVGDAAFQKKCIGKMSRVAAEGRTVVLVTHSMSLAENLTERCIWIDNGSVRDNGPTEVIVQKYLNHQDSAELGVTEGLGDYRLRRGPGNTRLSGMEVVNGSDERTTRFKRGEEIRFRFRARVFKRVPSLGLYISFKNGMAGNILVHTAKLCVSEGQIEAGGELAFSVHVDTLKLPASVYDLQIWLGPFSSESSEEFYDIVDSLTAPISIVEDSDRPDRKTLAPARVSGVTRYP